MAEAPPGDRNDVLNWCAYTAAKHSLDIFTELEQAAEQAGLNPVEIQGTIASGRKAGERDRAA